MVDIKTRLSESVGDVDKLNALLDEVQNDTSLSAVDRRLGVQSIQMHIKMASGKPLVQHDKIGGKSLTAVNNVDGVEHIGMLVMFSVSESGDLCAVLNDELIDYWTKHGLNSKDMPNPHREKDAFKKACADFKGAKPVSDIIRALFPSASRVYWDIDQLSGKEYQITRKIVSVVGDAERKDDVEMHTLSHDKICKLILDETKTEIQRANGKKTTEVTLRYRIIPEVEEYAEMTEEIYEEFITRLEFYKTHTTGKKIRDGIRAMLERNNGICLSLTRGGTWFLPMSSEVVLAQFKDFTKWVSENHTKGFGVARMFTIGMADEMDFKRQVEDDVKSEMQNRMKDLYVDTLAKLTNAETEDEIDGILASTLKEHGKNEDMLNQYKDILKTSISVRVQTEELKEVRAKGGRELSGRQKAMLDRLIAMGYEK